MHQFKLMSIYQCIVSPEIKTHPKNQTVALSSRFFTLNCSATGFPAPTAVTWFHNGSQLQTIAPSNGLINNYTISSIAEIGITGLSTTGTYFCRAELNGHESVDSNPAFVVVAGMSPINFNVDHLNIAAFIHPKLLDQTPSPVVCQKRCR